MNPEIYDWIEAGERKERERCARIIRYWADCNREAFPDQALVADTLAAAVEDPTRDGGLDEATLAPRADGGSNG